MRRAMVLALLTMSTSGCVTASSNACPRVVEYPKEVEQQADTELQALPKEGVVRARFMPDYGQLRAGARECVKLQRG